MARTRRSLAQAAACVLVLAAAARAEIIDRVVAIVSGQIVTQSDVNAAKAFGLAATLDEMIDRMLMLAEVRRVAPPDPATAAIEARVARMTQTFPSPAALAQELARDGIDGTALREYAADDLRLSTYINERFSATAQPTDEEIRRAGEGSRERLAAEHRQALVDAWLAELKRRAEITVLDTERSPQH